MIDKDLKTLYDLIVANKSDKKGRDKMKNYQLVVARKRRGYSQGDMAKLLGIDRTTYNYKENGKSLFNIEETARVVSFLNLTFDEINEIFFDNAILK